MAEKIVSQEEVERAATALAEIVRKSQIISHLSPYTSGGEDGFAGAEKREVKTSDLGKTVDETDYIGVKKALVAKAQGETLTFSEALILGGVNPLSSIAEKIGKSEALTPAEVWAVNGGVAKAIAKGEMKEKEKKEDRVGDAERAISRDVSEQKEDTMKSLLAILSRAAQPVMATGITPLSAVDGELRKAFDAERSANASFREDVAKGLSAISQLLAAQAEQRAVVQPARGPRGALSVIPGGAQPQQGFGAFGPEEMTKKAVSVEIRTRLEKGDPSVNEDDLLMWEAELQMRPELKTLLAQSAR